MNFVEKLEPIRVLEKQSGLSRLLIFLLLNGDFLLQFINHSGLSAEQFHDLDDEKRLRVSESIISMVGTWMNYGVKSRSMDG